MRDPDRAEAEGGEEDAAALCFGRPRIFTAEERHRSPHGGHVRWATFHDADRGVHE